jgi:hypothetical protein
MENLTENQTYEIGRTFHRVENARQRTSPMVARQTKTSAFLRMRSCIIAALTKSSARRQRLYSSHQQQDEKNDHHQTQAAAWIITPAPTVGPRWQRAEQQQNQNDQKDCWHTRLNFRKRGFICWQPVHLRQSCKPTLLTSGFDFNSSVVDVAINFHIAGRCSNIQDSLLPLATGQRKSREASGEYNKSCNKYSFEHGIASLNQPVQKRDDRAPRSPVWTQGKSSSE